MRQGVAGLDTVFQQLLLNYVTDLAHADAFARLGRRFLVARWASDSLALGAPALRHYLLSLWTMPERTTQRRAPPVLSPYNTARLYLQVRLAAVLPPAHLLPSIATHTPCNAERGVCPTIQSGPL